MSKFLRFEQCPRCAERGKDKSADNLGVYSDGSAHCFSCGYHKHSTKPFARIEEKLDAKEKAVLPRDFTKEVPSKYWQWLLQYGLPYSYWKPYTGYSEKDERLIFTFGKPVRFSIGRSLDVGKRKWFFYGDGHTYVEAIGRPLLKKVVLVEDIISAHKVGHITSTICLFGTNIHDVAVRELLKLKLPVVLWLDKDQYEYLPKKIGRLKSLINYPVTYVHTEKDPKEYSLDEIKEYLNVL